MSDEEKNIVNGAVWPAESSSTAICSFQRIVLVFQSIWLNPQKTKTVGSHFQ